MAPRSSSVRSLAVSLCWIGGVLLAVGSLLLAFEGALSGDGGIDVGPSGANFVILGAMVSGSGFWILQPQLDATAGLKVAAALVAFGIACLILSAYSEPFLVRAVAAAALITGIRGAGHHFGGALPHLRYEGAMPLGEMAAMLSFVANGIIVVYLLYKSRALGMAAPSGYGAILAWTALFVGGVLVVESLILRFMRKNEETETLEDERDERIKDEAARIAHILLVTVVVLLVVQLGLGSALDGAGSPNAALGLSSSVAIAHALLGLLFLSECGRRIAEIWLYRRARH